MKDMTHTIGQAVVVGIDATATMDLTAEVLRRTRASRSLDYALVGRWVGHMPRGRFRHRSILTAASLPHERAMGWGAHYAIGSGFAVALVLADPEWLDDPRFLPAASMGLATVAAPWLVMQPALGLGIAASRTPNPAQARLASLRAHAAYGVGLWVCGTALATLRRRLTA